MFTRKSIFTCKRNINTPNFFEVDKILDDYVEEHDKKFGRYLIYCEIKLELTNNFNPHIKGEYFYNIDFISMQRFLLNWIDYFFVKTI